MTDLDNLTKLLVGWMVPYQVEATDTGLHVSVGYSESPYVPRGAKITGYGGFYTLYEFDDNGKFICMGAWE